MGTVLGLTIVDEAVGEIAHVRQKTVPMASRTPARGIPTEWGVTLSMSKGLIDKPPPYGCGRYYKCSLKLFLFHVLLCPAVVGEHSAAHTD